MSAGTRWIVLCGVVAVAEPGAHAGRHTRADWCDDSVAAGHVDAGSN